MLNIKKIIVNASIFASATIVILSGTTFAADPTPSVTLPSIVEISHTHPEWLEPTIRMPQVPESEIVHISYNNEWFFKNDTNPDPDSVTLTFPANWVQHSQVTTYDDNNIELSVPKK